MQPDNNNDNSNTACSNTLIKCGSWSWMDDATRWFTWLGSMFPSVPWHQWLDDRKSIWYVKDLCHLSPEVMFHNRSMKKTGGNCKFTCTWKMKMKL